MNRYTLGAKVTRVVTDIVSLTVRAESADEARIKAARALQTFPQESQELDVVSCYIEDRKQDNVEVVRVWEEVEDG